MASLGAKVNKVKPKSSHGPKGGGETRLDPWGDSLNIAPHTRTAEQRRFEERGHFGSHSGKIIYETDSKNVQDHLKSESRRQSIIENNKSFGKTSLQMNTGSNLNKEAQSESQQVTSPTRIVRCKIGPATKPP